MKTDYIYAVARIRSLEMALFSKATIEQLLAEKTYEGSIRFLKDHGWGDSDNDSENADVILSAENKKTWDTIREMVPDMEPFSVLTLPEVYHNLKAAVKVAVAGEIQAKVFFEGTNPSGEKMVDIIKRNDFDELPKELRDVAREAYETIVHTADGQLCDITVDRAALKAIKKSGEESDEELLKEYAKTYVTVANIRTAVRSSKTGKSMDFMRRAMEPIDTLDIEKLMVAAIAGPEEVIRVLSESGYAEAAESLKVSPSAFECWCDNEIIKTIQPQKYNSFTIGALVAYILARLNEIKTVRIILSGKLNNLSETDIRERVREMYV